MTPASIVTEMRIALANAEAARNRSIIAVLGNTGSGKSTSINYLAGFPMHQTQQGIDVIPPAQAIAKIGHKAISETTYATVYQVENRYFVDTGGFLDTREGKTSVSVPFSIKCTLQNARDVKIILCADISLLWMDRGVHVTELFKTAIDRLVGDCRMDCLSKSFLLLITKVRPMPTAEEAVTIPATIDLVQLALRTLRASATPTSLEQRVYDFVLRDGGKYIAMINPLDKGQSRLGILEKLDAMQPVASPQECFNYIPYSSETRLWIHTTMRTIAEEGRVLYETLGFYTERINELKTELAVLTEKIDSLQQCLDRLTSDPDAKSQMVAKTKEQLTMHQASHKALLGQIALLEREVSALGHMVANLQTRGNLQWEYKNWTFTHPAINTEDRVVDVSSDIDWLTVAKNVSQGASTGEEIGGVVGGVIGGIFRGVASIFSRDEKRFRFPGVRLPITGHFHYQGPTIACLELHPPAESSCWTFKGGVNSQEYEARYQSEAGAPADAKVRVFVLFKDLPTTLLEKARLESEIARKKMLVFSAREGASKYEGEMILLSDIEKMAADEADRAKELGAAIAAFKEKIEERKSQLIRLQTATSESLQQLREKAGEFSSLDQYLDIAQDSELCHTRVVQDYLSLRRKGVDFPVS